MLLSLRGHEEGKRKAKIHDLKWLNEKGKYEPRKGRARKPSAHGEFPPILVNPQVLEFQELEDAGKLGLKIQRCLKSN